MLLVADDEITTSVVFLLQTPLLRILQIWITCIHIEQQPIVRLLNIPNILSEICTSNSFVVCDSIHCCGGDPLFSRLPNSYTEVSFKDLAYQALILINS